MASEVSRDFFKEALDLVKQQNQPREPIKRQGLLGTDQQSFGDIFTEGPDQSQVSGAIGGLIGAFNPNSRAPALSALSGALQGFANRRGIEFEDAKDAEKLRKSDLQNRLNSAIGLGKISSSMEASDLAQENLLSGRAIAKSNLEDRIKLSASNRAASFEASERRAAISMYSAFLNNGLVSPEDALFKVNAVYPGALTPEMVDALSNRAVVQDPLTPPPTFSGSDIGVPNRFDGGLTEKSLDVIANGQPETDNK